MLNNSEFIIFVLAHQIPFASLGMAWAGREWEGRGTEDEVQ